MKKIISILILAVIVATGCKTAQTQAQSQKLAGSTVKYNYHAVTRGSMIDIAIDEKDIYPYKGRPNANDIAVPYKKTDAKEWAELLQATENIDLEKLEEIAVPSKKHQFDGAMAATLTITVDGKSYETPTFDHGNPPAEVKKLVEKIIEISELEK